MTLNPSVKGSQYSVGGNWENAVKINLDNPQGTKLVSDIDESVAVEVFYELSDGRMVFLGLRYSEGLRLADSPTQFLQKVLAFVAKVKEVNFSEALKLLGQILNDDENTYTMSPIGYVELGVEGFWKSEGSLVLRKALSEKLSEDTLIAKLGAYPHLVKSTKNHTALEFAITEPKGWIGVQVSRKKGDLFATDLDSLLTLANLI